MNLMQEMHKLCVLRNLLLLWFAGLAAAAFVAVELTRAEGVLLGELSPKELIRSITTESAADKQTMPPVASETMMEAKK